MSGISAHCSFLDIFDGELKGILILAAEFTAGAPIVLTKAEFDVPMIAQRNVLVPVR